MPETERSSEVTEAPGEAIERDEAAPAAHGEAADVSVSNPGSEPAKVAGTKSTPAKKSAPRKAKDPHKAEFLEEQRILLLQERESYTKQADELKAEADSLALEHEPGDVQFDEEGGEGGTSNVDRELDLLLSAQARGAVLEIDRALAKIDAGNYGSCEQCGQPIPQARLKALPYAALCVGCKSGGLSRR
jgi:DnaK suppressor protein